MSNKGSYGMKKKNSNSQLYKGLSKGLPALRMFSLLPLSFPCAHDGDHLRKSLSKTSQQAGLKQLFFNSHIRSYFPTHKNSPADLIKK